MYYVSTRGQNQSLLFHDALVAGLAQDGGLFIPESFPECGVELIDAYSDFASAFLQPFVEPDALADVLDEMTRAAFSFPLNFHWLDESTQVLELFHGPTLSFKDFGARFLAQCMSRLEWTKPLTVMVATSGDTGSAVASAFHRLPNTRVVVLFPQGKISARQQHQITCWGDNVLALAVDGCFDDCQRLVKQSFAYEWWRDHAKLSTANSINIARLLPQVVYYAYASLKFYERHGEPAGFIVPSGNLGNVTAAHWAKRLGFPLREIAIATNANEVVYDYWQTGQFRARPSQTTLANAMDVGNPSNFERLLALYPDWQQFRAASQVAMVSDDEIRAAIRECLQRYDYFLCPHTATAYFMRQRLSQQPWVIVATAHPAKFETIVEPLIGRRIALPDSLQQQLQRPAQFKSIAPEQTALIDAYLAFFQGNTCM